MYCVPRDTTINIIVCFFLYQPSVESVVQFSLVDRVAINYCTLDRIYKMLTQIFQTLY